PTQSLPLPRERKAPSNPQPAPPAHVLPESTSDRPASMDPPRPADSVSREKCVSPHPANQRSAAPGSPLFARASSRRKKPITRTQRRPGPPLAATLLSFSSKAPGTPRQLA